MFNSGNTSFGGFGSNTGGAGSGFKFGQTTQSSGFSFGGTAPTSSGGGLFSSSATNRPNSLFNTASTSQPASGFSGFGAPSSAATSSFNFGGAATNTTASGGGLFGGGQKTGGLFGTTTSTGGGLFGATSSGGGGLFGTTSATVTNGTTIPFEPFLAQESINQNNQTRNVTTKMQCITAMKQYESKSIEELRMEDYAANRKQGTQQVTGGLFGAQPAASTGGGLFGATANAANTGSAFSFGTPLTKSLFGGTTSNTATVAPFGSASTGGGLFASKTTASTGGLFGSTNTGTSGFSFGSQTTQSSGGLFGQTAAKPALSTGFSFQPTTNTTSGGLFGNKPAGTTAFGGFGTGNTAAAPTGGGLFGGAATNQSAGGGLFGTKPAFGVAPVPTVGGGLFGNTATASQPFSLQSNQPLQQVAPVAIQTVAGIDPVDVAQREMINQKISNLVRHQSIYSDLYKDVDVSPSSMKKNDVFLSTTPAQYASRSLMKESPSHRVGSTLHRDSSSGCFIKRRSTFAGSDDARRPNSSFETESKADLGGRMLFAELYKLGNEAHSPIIPTGNNSITRLNIDVVKAIEAKYASKQRNSLASDANQNSSAVVFGTADISNNNTDLSIGRPGLASTPLNVAKKPSVAAERPSIITGAPDMSPGVDLNSSSICAGSASRNAVEIKQEKQRIFACGARLTRSDYVVSPSLDDLVLDENGNCFVTDFMIERPGYGYVKFEGATNIAHLNIDETVHIRRSEIVVYQNDEQKPPLGEGLNKPATVQLLQAFPRDKSNNTRITDVDQLREMKWAERMEMKSVSQGAKFIDYIPGTGAWIFRVSHFSKYGLGEDHDDDQMVPVLPNAASEIHQQVATNSKAMVADDEMISDDFISQKENQPISSSLNLISRSISSKRVDLSSQLQPEFFFDSNAKRAISNFGAFVEPHPHIVDSPASKKKLTHPSYTPSGKLFLSDFPTSLSAYVKERHVEEQKEVQMELTESAAKNVKPKLFVAKTKQTYSSKTGIGYDDRCVNGKTINKFVPAKIVDHTTSPKGAMSISGSRVVKADGSLIHLFPIQPASSASPQANMLYEKCLSAIRDETAVAGGGLLSRLISIGDTFSRSNEANDGDNVMFLTSLFSLVHALFTPLSTTPNETDGRRLLVSDWLRCNIKRRQQKQTRSNTAGTRQIFEHLLCFEVEKAAEIAFQLNYRNLALCLSQIAFPDTKEMVLMQLNDWASDGVLETFDPFVLKAYCLIASVLDISCGDFSLKACEGLTWIESLGLCLWYCCDPTCHLEEAVGYFNDCADMEKCTSPFSSSSCDVRFLLLKLACGDTSIISQIFSPCSYHSSTLKSDNCGDSSGLNYLPTFIVMQLLKSINISIIDNLTNYVVVSTCEQLINENQNKFAIFVAQFANLEAIRNRLSEAVLMATVATSANYSEVFDIDFLPDKVEMIHRAIGNREVNHDNMKAFDCFLLAKDYQLAHEIFLQLAPGWFVNDKAVELKEAVSRLSRHKSEIIGFSDGCGFYSRLLYLFDDKVEKSQNGFAKELNLAIDLVDNQCRGGSAMETACFLKMQAKLQQLQDILVRSISG